MIACHPVDTGAGETHDCHEKAESEWTSAECSANETRCVTLCTNPRDGG